MTSPDFRCYECHRSIDELPWVRTGRCDACAKTQPTQHRFGKLQGILDGIGLHLTYPLLPRDKEHVRGLVERAKALTQELADDCRRLAEQERAEKYDAQRVSRLHKEESHAS